MALAVCLGASFRFGLFVPILATGLLLGGLGFLIPPWRPRLTAIVVGITVANAASQLVPSVGGIEITSWAFLGLAVLGVAVRLSEDKRGHPVLTGVEWGSLAIVLAGGVALAVGATPPSAVSGLLRMSQHVMILLAIASLKPTWSSVRLIVAGLLAGVGVQVIIGFTELFRGATFFYGLWKPLEAASWNGILRVASTPADPNYFALSLVGTLPILLALPGLWQRTSGPVVQAAAAAWFLLICFTFSRAGYIGLLVLLVVELLSKRSDRRWPGLLPALLVGATVVLLFSDNLGSFGGRLLTLANTQGDASVAMRLAAQRAAIDVFLSHPLFGIGFDRFVQVGPSYVYASTGLVVQELNVLDSFLLTASEGGMFALAGLLFATIWSIVHLFRPCLPQSADSVAKRRVFLSVGTSLVVWSVVSLTLDGIHDPILWVLFGLTALLTRWTYQQTASDWILNEPSE
ncbi:MAG: O-antigen ligase family protein [Candidatus Limnocylindrales bacterium]